MRKLQTEIRQATDYWRGCHALLNSIESRLKEEPGVVCRELYSGVTEKLLECKRVLRRYGVEIPMREGTFDPELVAPEHLPGTLTEWVEYNDAAHGATAYWYAWKAGRVAIEEAEDLDGAASFRLVGWAMIEALRKAGVFYGIEMGKRELPPALRERGLVGLAGHVAHGISLRISPRLRAAVSDEAGLNPLTGLLDRLPAAVMIEWEEATMRARLQKLRSRVTKRLEGEGGEQAKLKSPPSLPNGPVPMVSVIACPPLERAPHRIPDPARRTCRNGREGVV